MHSVDRLLREIETRQKVGPQPDDNGWARRFTFGDPSALPKREWILAPHYIRGHTSLTISPGGVGKSSLALLECIAIATGRPLLGVTPSERQRVWYFNGEDPLLETEGRVHAILQHYDIPPDEIEGWLFIGSGRDRELVICNQDRNGAMVVTPVVDELVAFLKRCGIGVAVIDPFVSTHRVQENDNGALDLVAKAWAKVAQRTSVAIAFVHHTRKLNGTAASMDDTRGASSLSAAVRHARTLAPLDEQSARNAGIPVAERDSYVRINEVKSNLRRRNGDATFFHLKSVTIANGDDYQVVEQWMPPAASGIALEELEKAVRSLVTPPANSPKGWRVSRQARGAWAGDAVIDALGLTGSSASARAEAVLKQLEQAGRITQVSLPIGNGKTAPFYQILDQEESSS